MNITNKITGRSYTGAQMLVCNLINITMNTLAVYYAWYLVASGVPQVPAATWNASYGVVLLGFIWKTPFSVSPK